MAKMEGLPEISTCQSSWWARLHLDVDDRWVGVQQLAEVGTNVFLSQHPGDTAGRWRRECSVQFVDCQFPTTPTKRHHLAGNAAAGNYQDS